MDFENKRDQARRLNNTGVTLYRSGNYNEALRHFDKAVGTMIQACDCQPTMSCPRQVEESTETVQHLPDNADTFVPNRVVSQETDTRPVTLDMLPTLIPGELFDHKYGNEGEEIFKFSETMLWNAADDGYCFCGEHRCNFKSSAKTLYNLALSHHRLGYLQQSLRIFELALNLGMHVHQERAENISVISFLNANIMMNMGQLHYKMGNIASAMDSFAEALRHSQYFSTSPNQEVFLPLEFQQCILNSLAGIRRTLYRKGDFDRAAEFALEHIRMCQLLHRDGIHLAASVFNYGLIQYQRKRLDEASKLCLSFIELAENLLGPNNIHVADAHHAMGIIYGESGNFSKALGHLSQSLLTRKALLGGEIVTLADTEYFLAKVCKQMGNNNKAKKLLSKALYSLRQCNTASIFETVLVLCDMGEVSHAMGQFGEAFRVYVEALFCLKHDNEHNHEALIAHLLTTIGRVQIERGDVQDALHKFAEASQIRNSLNTDSTSPSCSCIQGTLDEMCLPGGAPAA